MTRRKGWVGALVVALLGVTTPALAHHSIAAEFDVNKPITFTGKVKQVDWMNPHIYTYIEVSNPDGTSVVYRVEGGTPNALYRQGWRKDTLKTGDTVTVSGVRAKSDASKNVGLATITLQDGRRIFTQGTGSRDPAQ
jgi:DNA/RNA endonuclease YhcR with UshA esterase domain